MSINTVQQGRQNKVLNEQYPHNQKEYVMFEEQDFKKVKKAEKKIYVAPLLTMSIFTMGFLIIKYGNLGKLLPNPFAQPKKDSKIGALLKTKGTIVFLHTLTFVGLASAFGAFIAKQIHLFQVYSKYKRQVAFYMRWKVETQIKKKISQQ